MKRSQLAFAVMVALPSTVVVAAPPRYAIDQNATPGAWVTGTFRHNVQDCASQPCYGYYHTDFPSMNDAGVIVGRVPGASAAIPSMPILQAKPAGWDGGQAVVWENGIAKQLVWPLVYKSTNPADYWVSSTGQRIYEERGCRDTNYDGVADNALCGSRGLGINNKGLIVGVAHAWGTAAGSYWETGYLWGANAWGNGPLRSPLWTNATTHTRNAGFCISLDQQNATGINEAGNVVGTAIATGGSVYDAQRHGHYGFANRDCGVIGAKNQLSTAHAINDSNVITGTAMLSPGSSTSQAYTWQNGAFTGWAPGLSGGDFSEGYDINNNGLVVGRARTSAGQERAFSWQSPSGAFTNLGTLGGTWSVARSVNNAGHIVGISTDASGENRGFIYQAGIMYDLNSYLSSPPSGWSIVDAYTITNNDEILVRATNPSTGGNAYWVLKPNGRDQGGTISSARLISPNAKLSAQIGTAGDNDVFKIVLPADGVLVVDTTGATNTYCQLLNSSGTALESNDNISSSNLNCRVGRYLAAGTYYGKIRHSSSTGTGNYTFNAAFAPDDGDNIDEARVIAVPSTTGASIAASGDIDYFTIYAAADKALTVKTTWPTADTPDMYCALFSTNGTQLAANDNYGTSTNCQINYTITPGIYHVLVRHSNSSGTGRYALVTQ